MLRGGGGGRKLVAYIYLSAVAAAVSEWVYLIGALCKLTERSHLHSGNQPREPPFHPFHPLLYTPDLTIGRTHSSHRAARTGQSPPRIRQVIISAELALSLLCVMHIKLPLLLYILELPRAANIYFSCNFSPPPPPCGNDDVLRVFVLRPSAGGKIEF